jgi:hypothetical protein
VNLLIILTFGAGAPLAHLTPLDQIWMGGFNDHADHDDVVLAVMGAEGIPDGGVPAFFPWTAITQLHSSPHPLSVTTDPRLTLADRAPPLR